MIFTSLVAWQTIVSGVEHQKHSAAASKVVVQQHPKQLTGLAGWIHEGIVAARIHESVKKPLVKPPARPASGPGTIAAAMADTAVLMTSNKALPPVKLPLVKPEDQLCSLNVSEIEIQKVLPLLTAQTGLNILLMSNSSSKMTLHVEKMRLIDLMRHVCALTGLSFLDVSGAYVVASAETLKAAYPDEWKLKYPPAAEIKQEVKLAPVLVTETFIANYVKTSQLVDTIKKLIPTDLEVIPGPSSESPSLSNVDPSEKTGQSSVSVAQDSGTSGSPSHIILLHGTKENVEAAIAIAKQVDVPRRQVNIAVTIHDISDDAVKNLGLSWNFSDFTLTASPNASGVAPGHAAIAPLTFDGAISALESKDVARLMASPNISVLDGEKAFVLIGDRINYPALTGYTSTNSPIFSVNTERVGIYLQVAATISSDGYITLTLYPQVSSITSYLTVNGASYPQISSREAQTTLRVKSGETIVLGGLLEDDDTLSVDKVPILSQIPFFGELFKHRQKTKNKSQVIIAIKPVIKDLSAK